MQSGSSKLKQRDLLILAAAFAAFLLLARLVSSGTWCFFRTFTGLPCPGCGLTSAGLALLHGDFAASWRYHPLLLPVLMLLIIYRLRDRIGWCGRLHRSRLFYPAALVILMLCFLLRLMLYFPNSEHPMSFSRNSVLYQSGIRLRQLIKPAGQPANQ